MGPTGGPITKNVGQYGNSFKNWPQKISESIHAFFWFLCETGRAVGDRFLKACGFMLFPINVCACARSTKL
jgi:hypothetical protein